MKKYSLKEEIMKDFRPSTKSVTVFLVVGVDIATGLRVRSSRNKSMALKLAGFINADSSSGHDIECTFLGPRLFAYSVREFILISYGEIF
jgi:hypothetical protein